MSLRDIVGVTHYDEHKDAVPDTGNETEMHCKITSLLQKISKNVLHSAFRTKNVLHSAFRTRNILYSALQITGDAYCLYDKQYI